MTDQFTTNSSDDSEEITFSRARHHRHGTASETFSVTYEPLTSQAYNDPVPYVSSSSAGTSITNISGNQTRDLRRAVNKSVARFAQSGVDGKGGNANDDDDEVDDFNRILGIVNKYGESRKRKQPSQREQVRKEIRELREAAEETRRQLPPKRSRPQRIDRVANDPNVTNRLVIERGDALDLAEKHTLTYLTSHEKDKVQGISAFRVTSKLELESNPWYKFAKLVAGKSGISINEFILTKGFDERPKRRRRRLDDSEDVEYEEAEERDQIEDALRDVNTYEFFKLIWPLPLLQASVEEARTAVIEWYPEFVNATISEFKESRDFRVYFAALVATSANETWDAAARRNFHVVNYDRLVQKKNEILKKFTFASYDPRSSTTIDLRVYRSGFRQPKTSQFWWCNEYTQQQQNDEKASMPSQFIPSLPGMRRVSDQEKADHKRRITSNRVKIL